MNNGYNNDWDQFRNNNNKPSLYQIWMIQGEATTSHFLYKILKTNFHYSNSTTINMIREISDTGYTMCGTYTKDIAETKVHEVMKKASSDKQFIKLIIQKGVEHVVRKS
ncbi:hypothetical protein CAXC1_90003 [Candidatus Xenohaliotis californiensis]|uniref:Adaptor protein ClpS core domain-containing protein n=1 Tax=Candidatus Xenohaliotis californiensis TaxID=84677 RepID=A0ABP0EUE6_9RICK|nr:hypothetical protein CAXC1_90003 [Candidatus Xenohaliotis californiensis]